MGEAVSGGPSRVEAHDREDIVHLALDAVDVRKAGAPGHWELTAGRIERNEQHCMPK